MGRGRVEMKRIDNVASRGATFCKRRAGLLKKAHELAVLCDAHLGVIVFSSSGNLFDYCSPRTSWSELIERYESSSTSRSTNDIQLQEMPAEIESLRQERDHLEASLRRQTGEDLSSLATEEELDDLQQQLESVLRKVRQRTDELLTEQLEESRHKVDILEDQNNFLRHTMNEEDMELQHAAVESEGTLFGGFFPEVEEERGALTSLQLWPELTQPSSLHDH